MRSFGLYSYILYDTPCGAFHRDLILLFWESSPTVENMVRNGWLHFFCVSPQLRAKLETKSCARHECREVYMSISWEEIAIEVVKFILELIRKGWSKSDAITQAALKFNLSESDILNIFDKNSNK